jgi:hypothetical protein
MSRLNRKPIDVCSVIWRYVWQKRLDPDRRNSNCSPPASLETQRSRRDFSFNFLLSPAKDQQDVIKGRKLKTHVLREIE